MAQRASNQRMADAVSLGGLMAPLQRVAYSSATLRRLIKLAIIIGAALIVAVGAYATGSMNLGIFVVAGLIAALGGVLIVVRPDIGMWILVTSIYTNSSDVLEVAFGIPSLNQFLMVLVFVSVIGTRAVIQQKPLRFGITEGAIAFYMVVAVLTLFAAGEIGLGIDNIIDFIKDFIIVIVLVQLCGEEPAWKGMQWGIIGGAGVLSTMTVYQTVTGNYAFEFWGYSKVPFHQIIGEFDSARPTGPLDDPNYYSQILLMAQPLAFYRWYTGKVLWSRGLAFFFWAMIILTVIFSYSRSSFLMLVAIMGIIVLERKMDLVKVGLGGAVVLVAVTPLLPQGYLDRLATLGSLFGTSVEMQTEASFEGRTSQAIVAFLQFRDHPLTGIGYSLYDENYLEYSNKLGLDWRGEARAAHSIYLEVMAETGVVGILSFGFMLWVFYSVSQKAVRDLTAIGREDLVPWIRGIQLGFLSYLFTSLFLHDDWVRYFRLGLALMASCSVMADTVIANYWEERRKAAARTTQGRAVLGQPTNGG